VAQVDTKNLPIPIEDTAIETETAYFFWKSRVSIFRFFTPGMMAVLAVIVTIVSLNFDNLYVNFQTNVPLNGLIIFIIIHTLASAVWNNLKLWRAAHYLMDVDKVLAKDEPTAKDVSELQNGLDGRGHLFSINNMSQALDNITKFGILNFSDTDCRLIKSKVGFRVRMARGNVGFKSGILVMLGLLGTFWGLLSTIDAVGQAMGSMSSISDDEEGMADFMSSLAAPLQGMGLAFSSSLFGLSGSLLIGYFNHLCGSSQNSFMENVSLWVDTNIPSPEHFSAKKPKNGEAAKEKNEFKKPDGELNAWLAGFAAQAVKTDRKLGALLLHLSDQSKNTEDLAINSKAFHDELKSARSVLDNINSGISDMSKNNNNYWNNFSEHYYLSQEQLLSEFNAVNVTLEKNLATSGRTENNTHQINQNQKIAITTLTDVRKGLEETVEQAQLLNQLLGNNLLNKLDTVGGNLGIALKSLSNIEESGVSTDQNTQNIYNGQKQLLALIEKNQEIEQKLTDNFSLKWKTMQDSVNSALSVLEKSETHNNLFLSTIQDIYTEQCNTVGLLKQNNTKLEIALDKNETSEKNENNMLEELSAKWQEMIDNVNGTLSVLNKSEAHTKLLMHTIQNIHTEQRNTVGLLKENNKNLTDLYALNNKDDDETSFDEKLEWETIHQSINTALGILGKTENHTSLLVDTISNIHVEQKNTIELLMHNNANLETLCDQNNNVDTNTNKLANTIQNMHVDQEKAINLLEKNNLNLATICEKSENIEHVLIDDFSSQWKNMQDNFSDTLSVLGKSEDHINILAETIKKMHTTQNNTIELLEQGNLSLQHICDRNDNFETSNDVLADAMKNMHLEQINTVKLLEENNISIEALREQNQDIANTNNNKLSHHWENIQDTVSSAQYLLDKTEKNTQVLANAMQTMQTQQKNTVELLEKNNRSLEILCEYNQHDENKDTASEQAENNAQLWENLQDNVNTALTALNQTEANTTILAKTLKHMRIEQINTAKLFEQNCDIERAHWEDLSSQWSTLNNSVNAAFSTLEITKSNTDSLTLTTKNIHTEQKNTVELLEQNALNQQLLYQQNKIAEKNYSEDFVSKWEKLQENVNTAVNSLENTEANTNFLADTTRNIHSHQKALEIMLQRITEAMITSSPKQTTGSLKKLAIKPQPADQKNNIQHVRK